MALWFVAEHIPEACILQAVVLQASEVVAVYTPEACILQAVVLQASEVVARVDDPAISPAPVIPAVWVQEFAPEVAIPPVYRKPRKMTLPLRFYCHNNNKT